MRVEKQKYPEHEKLNAVQDKSQTVGEFIEWLRSVKKIILAESVVTAKGKKPEDDIYDLMPAFVSIQKILAEFFDVDLQKLEEEKRTMLEELRKHHREKEEVK